MSARVTLPVPGHERGLSVVRHGHYGRPVLVFPSEAGSADDFADNGMVEAVGDLVEAGRVTFFCVDSLDAWTWSATDQPTEERARRHGTYHAWLEQQVLPWVVDQVGGPTDLITLGVSLGAYHAVHFTLQRADVAPVAIGLSGNYDPSTFSPWGEVADATYFANPTAYLANAHGPHLDWLRSRVAILLVCGQGAWETHPTRSLPSTLAFADVLRSKQIHHELDLWGHDSAHDWPWWRRQLAHHLPRLV
jgi:esterase/lipase superfamily enzyme